MPNITLKSHNSKPFQPVLCSSPNDLSKIELPMSIPGTASFNGALDFKIHSFSLATQRLCMPKYCFFFSYFPTLIPHYIPAFTLYSSDMWNVFTLYSLNKLLVPSVSALLWTCISGREQRPQVWGTRHLILLYGTKASQKSRSQHNACIRQTRLTGHKEIKRMYPGQFYHWISDQNLSDSRSSVHGTQHAYLLRYDGFLLKIIN